MRNRSSYGEKIERKQAHTTPQSSVEVQQHNVITSHDNNRKQPTDNNAGNNQILIPSKAKMTKTYSFYHWL